ncbi:hypothetical protein RHGRI_021622 [Rhododendron griersonianum]|uniref:Uncharacterized protein n=1 Tax=Rhododendron griersonianum TaxID=479676 RepID=A0AAV6JQC7_9ERIC|nr:hypothetical protein RHGRI_021622 [Rhododendron griersonianum]
MHRCTANAATIKALPDNNSSPTTMTRASQPPKELITKIANLPTTVDTKLSTPKHYDINLKVYNYNFGGISQCKFTVKSLYPAAPAQKTKSFQCQPSLYQGNHRNNSSRTKRHPNQKQVKTRKWMTAQKMP